MIDMKTKKKIKLLKTKVIKLELRIERLEELAGTRLNIKTDQGTVTLTSSEPMKTFDYLTLEYNSNKETKE